MMDKQEKFRPPIHVAPNSVRNRILFYVRWLLDFQFNTVYNVLKYKLPSYEGLVLDIGCGNCPFEHLINTANAQYIGIDVEDSNKWDYKNSKMITYDGKNLPFDSDSINHIICTEVIEHISNPYDLVKDMWRVLKPNGTAIITIPWSARFHYKPHDFYRYTPSAIQLLFSDFGKIVVSNRGTDINAIVNKSIVLYFRNFFTLTETAIVLPLKALILVSCAPIIGLLIVWGHMSLVFDWGSSDDPLGYTVHLTK